MGVHAVSLEILQIVTSTIRAIYLPCVQCKRDTAWGSAASWRPCNVVWPHQGPVPHSRRLYGEPYAQCNNVALGTTREVLWCYVSDGWVFVGWLGKGKTTSHLHAPNITYSTSASSVSLPPWSCSWRDALCSQVCCRGNGWQAIYPAEVREQHGYPPTVSAVRECSGNVVGVHAVSLEILQIVTSTIRAIYLPCVQCKRDTAWGSAASWRPCNVVWPHQGPVPHSRRLYGEPYAQCNKVALGTTREVLWCFVSDVTKWTEPLTYAWLVSFRTVLTRMITDNTAMWKYSTALSIGIVPWTQTLLETLKTQNRLRRGNMCIFGSRMFVPISWSFAESEVIPLGAGLRMDGIPTLDLWDMGIEVLHSSLNQPKARSNLLREKHCLKIKKTFHTSGDLGWTNVDNVTSNAKRSRFGALRHIFEDNGSLVKMINGIRSPTMRHVCRTHRFALESFFFCRINLDPQNPNQKRRSPKPTRWHHDEMQFHC